MKLKDLFQSTKTVQSSSLEDIARELESQEYIESYNKDRIRFLPNVDYSKPENFAFFGSAEKYYTDAFKRIRNTFPYDGSEKEKHDWLYESTFIDMYIFEERYPRFNGYVNLGYPSWGTLDGSIVDGYGKSTTNTYIKTFGGPNESSLSGLEKQFGDANKLDAAKTRESNLQFKLEDGVTIEMWVKKPAFDNTKTEKEVLFDLWNGEASSSAQYGRLTLELTGASSGSPFLLTAMSGTNGINLQNLGQNLSTASIEDWTHLAVSMKNSGNDLVTNIYINGQFNKQQTFTGASLGNVTGSLISYIGALQTAPSGSPTVQAGAGKFSGSLDEFRYWKTERTSKEIGRHYWTNIGGGTNTDDANTKLGVYYKFNEGITGTSSYDSTVLDYSGRVSNGAWTGYQSGARSIDSAMVLAGATRSEYKDPTIYSSHPQYDSILLELEQSGSIHDIQNNASLLNSMPGWIIEEDSGKEGNLRNLTQIIGSYYDNLYLHVKELNSLKSIYAHFQTEGYDIYANTTTTGSVKPLPFADRLLTNAGYVAPELFADATVLEALANRSEDEHYEMKIHDVKNQIYQNVYSSLVKTYKEKGTAKSFRNVLHAFGIDEDVVKINFYGDNVDFELNDRYTIRASKEKMVDFNHPDRFAGSVYQYASGANGVSFISGSGGDFEKYIPITFETQIIMPNKLHWNDVFGFNTPFTKSVIAGMHEADASNGSDYTIPGTDYCGIQIYSERDAIESKRVRFHISSSVLGVHMSSSLYDNMYLNNEWAFAFKIRNEKFPTTDLISSSSLGADYVIEFIGYNTEANTILNSFELTSSISAADAHNFLNSSKRIYVGAKRQNFTGSLEEKSDHKIGYVRYWMSNLSNDTILRHAYDSQNYGAESPIRSAYLMEDGVNDIKVPEIDTLILHWDFENLNSSDANGQFIAVDVTSGSGEQRYVQAFEDVKRKFYHARGDFFLANDEKVIDVEYVNAARSTYPEILQGSDMIEIRTQDDIQFTKETLPQDYYIAFEKSMAQSVSEEMIKFMSSVKDFNNLIGRPVDKYRQEYKDLRNLRQLFFERISNEPDLDKYIDYYKWLDDSLGEMLVALVPASLAHSDGVNNVIENYVFSRDKYDHKFPTIEFKTPVLEGGMNTINRHLYPWKEGHAPISGQEDDNCFWHLERKEKDEPRTKVFQARNSVLNRSFTTAQHFAVDRNKPIHGGINYEDNKKRDYIWSATKQVSESPLTYGEFGGFPLRYVLANSDMFQALKDCNDERPVTEKIKRAFSAVDGFTAFHHDMSGGYDGIYKGGMIMPFNIMSSSVQTGYADIVNGLPGAGENIDVVNVHSDTIDGTNEVPMQSPFTQRWVGGHQHRHAPINRGTDGELSRAEGYKILVNNIENGSGSIGVVGADYPHPYSDQADAPYFRAEQPKARYFREERAKRPVNIKNIQTTGSQVGNYVKNYQAVHTFGRTQNKTGLRDIDLSINLHNDINTNLPATNVAASLIARDVGTEGNVASNFNTSSLYLGDVKESDISATNGTSDSVMASKFSAPGGFDTMSEIFLDMYGKEHSVYNALPFRNLQVRGSGSGEANSIIKLYDIHGNRYGLLTHLTRHAAQGGIDSVEGGTAPAFHKVNRNAKWDASEEAYDHDNYWVQHQIPQSDYQYQWVKQSHTASLATSSLAGHILSGFTEPSGTTSVDPLDQLTNVVVSQSVIDQRIDGVTSYGFPSWEQIRNNDKPINNAIKKAYGYKIDSITVEESRVTENIPNTIDMKFEGSEFKFKYPFVNMRYHFDSPTLRGRANLQDNETMYDSLQGFYSSPEAEAEAFKKNVMQVIFPRHVKHTKYSTRHRHFFASHFWAKGENDAYNTNLNETGSYYRLDEQGRRETNVTASLFSDASLNSQMKQLIDDGYLTNTIPSQSIWSMDARTNFTSSNPQTAASNSAGAPGVLQNQDHHFHNGVESYELLQSGSYASGSFELKGATRFGQYASGAFTVQGMTPTEIPASGSFELTGANVQGTNATGEFTAVGTYTDPVSASMQFDVIGRTVLGTEATASFDVSGAYYAGSYTTGTLTFASGAYQSTNATSSFDIVTPVPGEYSSVIFNAIYQLAADGDYVVTGKNGSTSQAIIDINGTTISSPNLKLSPVVYERARQVTRGGYFAGTDTQNISANARFTLSFWVKLNTQLNGGDPSTLYSLQGTDFDGNQIETLNISFSGTNNDITIQRTFYNETERGNATASRTFNAGYTGDQWTNLIFFINDIGGATNSFLVAKNGSALTSGSTTYINYTSGDTFSYYNSTTQSVFDDGSISTGKQAIISDLLVWEASKPDFSDQGTIVSEIYRNGEFPANQNLTSIQSSPLGVLPAYNFTFGDDAGDGTAINASIEDARNGNGILTILGANTTDVDSVFANIKTKTEWFNHIKTQLQSLDTNSTQFNVNYVEYITSSTQAHPTTWYHSESTQQTVRPGTIKTDQVIAGSELNYATFYLVAKTKTNITTYDLTNSSISSVNSGITGSFTDLRTVTNTFADTDCPSTSISNYLNGQELIITGSSNSDTGGNYPLTTHINGTSGLTFNRVGIDLVSEYDTGIGYIGTLGDGYIYNPGDYDNINGLQPNEFFIVSFWYKSVSSPDTGLDPILTIVGENGGTQYPNSNIWFDLTGETPGIYFRRYAGNSAIDFIQGYASFATISSTSGLENYDPSQSNHYMVTFNISTANTFSLYVNGNSVTDTQSTTGTVSIFSSPDIFKIFLAGIPDQSPYNGWYYPYDCNGTLSNLAIYETGMPSSTSGARYLYNHGINIDHASTIYHDHLIHWWKLGGYDGWTTDGALNNLTNSVDDIIDDTPRMFKCDMRMSLVPSAWNVGSSVATSYKTGATLVDYVRDRLNLGTSHGYTATSIDSNTVGLENTTTLGSAGNGDTLSENSYMISNLVTTTEGGTETGLGVASNQIFYIRKGADYSTNVSVNTTYYVQFAIGDGYTTTTTTAGYTDNPVYIDVDDGSFRTDLALFNKIVDSINNHGLLNVTATYQNDDEVLIVSEYLAGGNSYFYSDSGTEISLATATGGDIASGSIVSHNIVIGSQDYTLSTATNSTTRTIDITDQTDEYVWSNLEAMIEATSSFNVSRTNVGNVATFELTAKTTGSAQNSLTLTGNGSSFDVTKTPEGGTDESGAIDGNYLSLYSAGYRYIRVDRDDDGASDATDRYVSSVHATDTLWWDEIVTELEALGYAASYSDNGNGTATFTVISFEAGADGNETTAAGSSGSTFTIPASPNNKFAGGVDSTGAQNGDTITIDGVQFEIIHSGTPTTTQVVASGVSNDTFWESLRTKIEANTGFSAVTGSDNPRTFDLTSVATGSSEDPNLSEVGTTFTIIESGISGTDESGAEDGDSITIDGHTFTIDLTSGLGTGSTVDFYNALTQSIKDNTDFDTVTYSSIGGGYYRFSLTSSVGGTEKNVAFTQNSNGTRSTFQNLLGAAGGTSEVGIGDLDYIRFYTDYDNDGVDENIFFKVDLNGDETDTSVDKYIDASGYTGTDEEKSTQFWNDLSQSIKDNTIYDTISINIANNVATFSITSSVTGTLANNDIYSVYNGADGIGFGITSNTAGGTYESGATAGDTITIDGTTFTIVHNASPTALQINASGVTDNEFFNALTAAIEANTDFSASFTVASNTGSFQLTSSVTGTAKNQSLTETGNDSFSSLNDITGGVNGIFSGIKFQEIIPQPRYNYPHTLQSPGSVRAPSAKSNLGLIDQDYKLRSNHFSLTRSLGYDTDGMFDNTSRWATPDLSGLTPMDDDYNTWYENIRGANKHFSLVPEFRISSHVDGIINAGGNLEAYFAKNYWLEITGASLDDGATVARNNRGNLTEFIEEYSTTTNIKNIDGFIQDNVVGMGMTPAKLTLTCEAIKSFLPYEGFYPQSRTVQLCEAFADSYGKGITVAEANPDDTELEFPENNVFAQTRPIFDAVMSPGLLYNTIKSGMAVDYPIVTSKMATASLKDPYGGTNYMLSNELFDDRLPFETLLKPEAHMSKKYIVDVNPHPSSSMNLKARLGNATNPKYKLMANNFFSEVMEFFLQDGKSSRIMSKPDTDPDFGIVVANHAGILPVYKSMFRVYKSKKQHPYIEFSGAVDIIKTSSDPSGAFDKYHNRPPSGTNYFKSEYEGLTGSALEYDVKKVDYPRPQLNPYAEVETITMYSQPNAFGPPCAGGVAVEFKGVGSTGENNNTTYMMYDSTNGYNAPFTPPYYDGEAWAIYTFTPQREGKHTLDEILQNTEVEFLRYEVNHESGSYGDRGTFGPQGLTLNDNAMQVDASFNLFKQVAIMQQLNNAPTGQEGSLATAFQAGKAWVIESKFETPILDFSKYLNREYNAEFESDVTSADIHTDKLSLSGSRSEPDTLSSVHPSLASVHELSGVLNPIGMWHQYGEFPESPDKGIFMQMMDVPLDYQRLGTELPIPNPKYIVVKPEISSCDGAGLDNAYNTNPKQTMLPYFAKQRLKRRLVGNDEFAVEGGAFQIVDANDIIIDTELRYEELQSIYGYDLADTGSAAENFRLFDVFRDSTAYTVGTLTTGGDFTSSATQMGVYINGTASADYNASSSSPFKGHWAASYYHYDRASSYAPLLIVTKDYNSLSYDYGSFTKGFFEDFLRDFSIGVPYRAQSTDFTDAMEVKCAASPNLGTIADTILAPGYLVDILEKNNNNISIGSLSKINITEGSRAVLANLADIGFTPAVTPSTATRQAAVINTNIAATKATSSKFKTGFKRTRTFKLIPPNPAVSALASNDTSSYNYPEPMFVRGAIRFNAGSASAGSGLAQRSLGYFNKMPQYAPQSDKNIAANPSTVRWGQFMHQDSENIRSLASLVGFDQDPVKMGVTAQVRELSEAVVAVPYLITKDGTPEYLTLDKDIIVKYLATNEGITDEAIISQIQKMRKYVIPPHIDFINNDVQPVPMYIFEFTKTLNRDDLNDLWQGVRSQSLKKVEFEEKEITHVLDVNSLLGNLKERDENLIDLTTIRWRIFKVKQKANFFYDSKMRQDLAKDGALTQPQSSEFDNTKFGYNWPYDYCSLVENVKMKVDIEFMKPEVSDGDATDPQSVGNPYIGLEIGTVKETVVVDTQVGVLGAVNSQPSIVEGNLEAKYIPAGSNLSEMRRKLR